MYFSRAAFAAPGTCAPEVPKIGLGTLQPTLLESHSYVFGCTFLGGMCGKDAVGAESWAVEAAQGMRRERLKRLKEEVDVDGVANDVRGDNGYRALRWKRNA